MIKQRQDLPTFTSVPAGEISAKLANSPCAACTVRQQSVCASLDNHELERLAVIAQAVYVAPGATVFQEGDAADYLFNVTDGVIKLYKLLPDGREQVTGFLFPGDFVGLALNASYGYSAEAITDLRLCRMARGAFNDVLAETPKLEHRLFTVASNELAQAQDQMLLLGRKTAREKIASFFLQLADRQERSRLAQRQAAGFADGADGPSRANGADTGVDTRMDTGMDKAESEMVIVDLPMGRADIADYLGLTTETVSRTLTQLKTDGSIRLLDHHQVEIHGRGALQDIAEGL